MADECTYRSKKAIMVNSMMVEKRVMIFREFGRRSIEKGLGSEG